MSESVKREVTQGGKRGSWAVANVLTNGLGHRRKRAKNQTERPRVETREWTYVREHHMKVLCHMLMSIRKHPP